MTQRARMKPNDFTFSTGAMSKSSLYIITLIDQFGATHSTVIGNTEHPGLCRHTYMLYNDLRTPGLEPFRLGQTITATNPLPASPLRHGSDRCRCYRTALTGEYYPRLSPVHASEELKKLSNSPVPVAIRSCHYAACEMQVPFPLYQSPSDRITSCTHLDGC
ncbi:predicted protein [Histoplasma capsulatum var. duboisii H88]|uniref:Predicted protein n=1 Tax=Ajellomyces capsulatus (strain H88) TaxID=544711 RepID=F0UNU6_AJEC8|nr:predicted protein [Histoplasma capsulatum var. duboisii H88]